MEKQFVLEYLNKIIKDKSYDDIQHFMKGIAHDLRHNFITPEQAMHEAEDLTNAI